MTPHYEVTLVLVLGLSVPVEDVSAGPDEGSDWKIAPGFLPQFAPRSILEAFTRVQTAAGRQPPPVTTRVLPKKKQDAVGGADHEHARCWPRSFRAGYVVPHSIFSLLPSVNEQCGKR